MISGSRKENIEPWKKLPPLGNKNNIPKIHLDKVKHNDSSPPHSYADSFISINIQTSKSPSTYREPTAKSTETLVESSEIKRSFLCSGCAMNSSDCAIF